MKRWLFACAAFITGGVGLAVAARAMFNAPGPLPVQAAVMVPRGGVAQLAHALQEVGVIDRRWAFEAAAIGTAADGALHGGEFVFPAHANLAEVLAVLRGGRRVQHKITFAEGLTAAQISRVVAQQPGLEGDITVPDEGMVLPETYIYERPATAAALLRRVVQARQEAIGAAWAGRAKGLPLRSAEEALVLASLVERETHLAAERPMVAAVFLNRLRMGMKLQADPSTVYGASGGLGRLDRLLTKDDLERADDYNTYTIAGLPVGPICSPGEAALVAVLHPAETDALYFVADGSGGHRFAASLSAHEKNVAHYRQLTK